MGKLIEISMAHNRPFMIEDKPLIMAIMEAGYNKISADYMWLIEVETDKDVEKIKEIFLSFPIHENKNFIVQ